MATKEAQAQIAMLPERVAIVETKVHQIEEKLDDLKADVKEMPESKARFLRAYGQGLSDAKTQFKEAGDIPKSSMEELGPGIFGIGASSDSVAKGNILGRQEMREAIKKERARAGMKKGGMVKSSASKRADGIAVKGKTRGKIC